MTSKRKRMYELELSGVAHRVARFSSYAVTCDSGAADSAMLTLQPSIPHRF